ncbi:MAG: hypothetical protein EHM80_04555 [Nitrospiraceae bacterium]|nr:MAG: hypothetical protein EHM80_04555 [Nitrospiraceae bacterium]
MLAYENVGGPALTHGGRKCSCSDAAGAREFVAFRAYAVGTIQQTFIQYSHIGRVQPATGYGGSKVGELEEIINRIPFDAALIATLVDLDRISTMTQPTCRVACHPEVQGISLIVRKT